MKNWIDIIRPDDYFSLIELNKNNRVPTNFTFGSNTARTKYDVMFEIKDVPENFIGEPPRLAFHTPIYKNTDDDNIPHGAKPAAAQRYGNVTLLWGHFTDDSTERLLLSSNEDFTLMHTIDVHDFIPHREDGFPAIIEMINLYKHFYHGCLHRVGNNPAIKMDYLIASWLVNGKDKRADGPCCITIKNYQEFWREGEYHGFREDDYYLGWMLQDASIHEVDTGRIVTPRSDYTGINKYATALAHFLNNLHGKTDIFANRYFTDAQDEVCFGAEFL